MSHVKIQTEHAPAAGLILAAGLGYAAWVQATGQGVPCPVPCADGAVLSGLRHHALPQCPFAGQLAGCPAQQCRHSGAGAFFCLAGLGGGAQLPYRRQRAADKAGRMPPCTRPLQCWWPLALCEICRPSGFCARLPDGYNRKENCTSLA